MLFNKTKNLFHIHTFRCKHAEMVPDEEYVLQAIELGASEITFTDHAPFPKDPFGNRMDFSQLDEYIGTLLELKDRYNGRMRVTVGLEVEYLPSYRSYYEYLKGLSGIEILILGQHFYECADGHWSFELKDKSGEWKYLLDAQEQGIQSGLFDVAAHPDRLFRREKQWTDELQGSSETFLKRISADIPLEINVASYRRKQLRPEFWNIVPDEHPKIIGCDAHSIRELQKSISVSDMLDKDYIQKNRDICVDIGKTVKKGRGR